MDPRAVHEPPPTRSHRPPARRSTTERMLGGVSTATSQYLGVSLLVARIVLALAVCVGGLGLVLYAALWLFVPDDDGRVLIHGQTSAGHESILAALLSGLATLALSAWITRDGASWLAAVLVTVGVFVLSRRGAVSDGPPPPTTMPPAPPRPPAAPPVPPRPFGSDPAAPAAPPPGPSLPGAPPAVPPPPVDPAVPGERPAEGATDPIDGIGAVAVPAAERTVVLPLEDRAPVYPRAAPGPRSAAVLDPARPAKPPKPPKPAAFLGPLTVSIAVALAGSLSLLHAIGAIELQPSDVLIVVLAVIGLGLLVSTWFGRARGLILLGLVLVPAVAISATADRIDFRGGIGDRNWSPQAASELQDRYRLGAGSLQLDLTGLDVATIDPADPVLRTELSLGAGQIQLIVPDTWTVDAAATVDLGSTWLYEDGVPVPADSDLSEFGGGEFRYDLSGTTDWFFPDGGEIPNDRGSGSGNVRTVEFTGAEGAPELDIDLQVTAGVVEVFRVAS